MGQDQQQDNYSNQGGFQTNDPYHFQPNDPVVHVFLPMTPLMQVVEAVRIKDGRDRKIAGIVCCWFGIGGSYCSENFNSKSIRHARAEELPTGFKSRIVKLQEKEAVGA